MDNITSTTFDGFTITGGVAVGEEGNGYGGGIFCLNVAESNTISNCVIRENWASWGGGIILWFSSPRLLNLTFEKNAVLHGGGGAHCYESDSIILNCTFSDNSANLGGGFYLWRSGISLESCQINSNTANKGGGAFCDRSWTTFANCVLFDNAARFGGGTYCQYFYGLYTNCTISNNSSTYGGIIYCIDYRPEIINSIFVNNDGYAISDPREYTSSALRNCLFYDNLKGDFAVGYGHYYRGAHDINLNVRGASNNISADPLFVDADNGNYHLQPLSPCIDAGIFAEGILTDIDGDQRPYDGTSIERGDGSDFDIGADEYTGPPVSHEEIYTYYINQLYHYILDRPASAAETAYFVNQLLAGNMRLEQVIKELIESKDYDMDGGFIARCYLGLFNINNVIDYCHPLYRIPDHAGASYWRSEMKRIIEAGGDIYDAKRYVVNAFLRSGEWGNRDDGMKHRDFVKMLYERILGRDGEAEGLAYHVDNLKDGVFTRDEVVLIFLDSPEARTLYKAHVNVAAAYFSLLQRTPDREGFIHHMNYLLLQPDGLLIIMQKFLGSYEYQAVRPLSSLAFSKMP